MKAIYFTLPFALLLATPASWADDTATSSSGGIVDRVEHAVERGASAAVHGVKRGAEAAAGGIQRGAEATEHGVRRGVTAAADGVETGAKATARVAGRVADKVSGSEAPENGK